MIDNNLAFELPLNNVSTTTTAKNEITLEFHQNDDAAVSLMEIRFHIPGDPANQEVDTVQVSLSYCQNFL
jgi:structure-specific recognition protein 1